MAVSIPKAIQNKSDVQKEIRQKAKNLKSWHLKTQDKELTFLRIENYKTEEHLQSEMKKKMKRMEREGYIEIDDEDLIDRIWGENIASKKEAFHAGNGKFLIWKYSARLKINDDGAEREKLFETMGKAEESLIMDYLKNEVDLYPNNYFINIAGKWEISRKWELIVFDSNNKMVMIRNGVLAHPKRRPVHITDLPLVSIKKAMKELGLNVSTPKSKK